MADVVITKDSILVPLDEANLQYVGAPIGWAGLWQYRDYQIELSIDGGGEEFPDERLISLAGIILPHLEAIESASDAYIRGFVNDSGRFYQGSWKLRSLRIWWNQYSQMAGKKFEVTLSVGEDDYGQWAVRFGYHTVPQQILSPYQFSRRQW